MAAERKVAGRRRRAQREDPHLQLQAEPGHRSPHRAHPQPAAGRAGRRPRRDARRAGRRRARPPARRHRRVTATWRQLWIETTAALGRRRPRRPTRPAGCARRRPGSSGAEWALGLDDAATPARRWPASTPWWRAGGPASRCSTCSGSWGFRHLDLLVDRRVLIPRPETEQVVEVALALSAGRAAAAGRGRPRHRVGGHRPVAGPRAAARPASRSGPPTSSPDALDVARANLAGLGRAAANVRLAEGDWFGALPADAARALRPGRGQPALRGRRATRSRPAVRDWEPAAAPCSPGPTGSTPCGSSSPGPATWLRPGGALVVEIGAGQGGAARRAGRAAGLVAVAVRPDLAGRDRVLVARRALAGSVC